jgi:hypothetical protein
MTMTSKKPLTNDLKDLATRKGGYSLYQTTVGSYLEMMGLYNSSTNTVTWDTSIVVDFQRSVLPINKNPIKRRMFRDLLRGGTLPPIVLYHCEGKRPLIVDGLQRTHVGTQGLSALIGLERGEKLEDFAKEEIKAIEDLKQTLLGVQEFLERPIILQQWSELESDELVRLFMLLNVGQQKVSPRHLLEVMGQQMKEMFMDWGILLLTEVDQKTQPVKRRRRRNSEEEDTRGNITESVSPFNYEYLLNGLYAYVIRNPHIKTKDVLENNNEAATLSLAERVPEIGSELCQSDFVWVCNELNDIIQDRYKDDPKWRVAIQNSDNFFIPLMAALGEARHDYNIRDSVEDKKQKLIELIKSSSDPDPLGLSRQDSSGLAIIQKAITSNIGKKQRLIVYNAWRLYFKQGFNDSTYPIDWHNASMY